jgi:hypothetical protein
LSQRDFEQKVAEEQMEYKELAIEDTMIVQPPSSDTIFVPDVLKEQFLADKFSKHCPEPIMALLRTSGRYALVGILRGHEVVFYSDYGQWQGEWLMVTRRPTDWTYFIWKGYFGSCEGCDDMESRMSNIENATVNDVWNFVKDYMPFMEIPAHRMKHAAQNFLLFQWMPHHLRTANSDIELQAAVDDIIGWVMLNEGCEPTFDHVIQVRNAELKRRLLELYTPEKMMEQPHSLVDDDTENDRKLVTFKEREGSPELTYVYVKDASTPRRYLLRVPPQMRSCAEAVAWTFRMDIREFQPSKET